MPSLRRLIEELGALHGDPDKIRVSGSFYDGVIDQVEDAIDEQEGDEEEDEDDK
jgi:hypothetical protein